ncbi:MAG: activator of Hsp90 ATPase 1 family protein [Rhodoglobus sp.]|nr:activator of Hsp90 ATPase 1 family protein [Rhodoglobus sp.]
MRKTVPAPVPVVWAFLMGEGLQVWLGDVDALPTEKGAAYETRDGVRGTIRSFTEGYRVRLSWQPLDWPHDTTLQVTVKEAAGGTTIGFHHDRLADRDERKMMLGYWKSVATAIAGRFEG